MNTISKIIETVKAIGVMGRVERAKKILKSYDSGR